MSALEPRRYLTHDGDQGRVELVVEAGGNGDWYVSIVPEGWKTARLAGITGELPTLRACVRVTTSGERRGQLGTANAIADLYRAMGGEPEDPLSVAALQRIANGRGEYARFARMATAARDLALDPGLQAGPWEMGDEEGSLLIASDPDDSASAAEVLFHADAATEATIRFVIGAREQMLPLANAVHALIGEVKRRGDQASHVAELLREKVEERDSLRVSVEDLGNALVRAGVEAGIVSSDQPLTESQTIQIAKDMAKEIVRLRAELARKAVV